MLKLDNLKPNEGAKKARRRVGRGIGSGMGKTSTKGQKGQNSRAGGGVRAGFEGGQMPLSRRLPKKGFRAAVTSHSIVKISQLNKLKDATIDLKALKKHKLVAGHAETVKVLFDESATQKLAIVGLSLSTKAKEAIIAAGGSVKE